MLKGWTFTVKECATEKICQQTSCKGERSTFRNKVNQNVPPLPTWTYSANGNLMFPKIYRTANSEEAILHIGEQSVTRRKIVV